MLDSMGGGRAYNVVHKLYKNGLRRGKLWSVHVQNVDAR